MKLIKFVGQTPNTVDVRFDVELTRMDTDKQVRLQVPPTRDPYTMTLRIVASLKKDYTATDVLAKALEGVDVPDGVYAVWFVGEGKETLKFILVADDMALELATPYFAKPQSKPFTAYSYHGTQETCDVHVCNMGTGITNRVHGYVVVDEPTSSVTLSNSITGSLNDGIYCARSNTRTAGYLTFFRMQRGTVMYLRTPTFVQHMGHWIYV